MSGTRSLLVMTPLRVETSAVQRGATNAEVVTTGMGPQRSRRAAFDLAARCAEAPAVAVAGFCGALASDLRAGDVVVASEVLGPLGRVPMPGAQALAVALGRSGLRVIVGPILSTDEVVRGARRSELAQSSGAVAADMESAWLIDAAAERPRAVVRVVVDTPAHELPSRWTLGDGVRAYRALRQAAGVLAVWGDAAGTRDILLAAPRSFCAGVDRAIDTVERAIERFGAPVYVRRQIVHNRHVVDELTRGGAVFVDELDEVPDGATVVFSAHGVAPSVRAEADRRGLHVVDATCPLVAKVHAETRRFARQGNDIVLIGHEGHDEIEGTLGEADRMHVVTTPGDVDAVTIADPTRVAYITQTTLAVDEAQTVIERLEHRFPDIIGPAADDICYATQNRQDAVRAIAPDCDLVLVVGSRNSSNSNRLVEVARREGCAAELIDDERDIDLGWLSGARTIGVTAGASAPEHVVQRVVELLAGLGPVTVAERSVVAEATQFALPSEVR